jgi:hypothetical protein
MISSDSRRRTKNVLPVDTRGRSRVKNRVKGQKKQPVYPEENRNASESGEKSK